MNDAFVTTLAPAGFEFSSAAYQVSDLTFTRVVVEAGTSETKTETETWVVETETEAI